MRKLLPLVLLLWCTSVAFAQGTQTPLQAREAEWKGYTLPQTNFARQISPEKEFLFRVPADWKQEGTDLVFTGPHTSYLRVTVQKIPDGYPFQEYVASILQVVRDMPGAAETTLTRKTQLQDLEAREIVLEMDNTQGEMFRSTTWITVSGPLALTFNFQTPVAHTAELEPFFKAVVQSVVFIPANYRPFEDLRSSIIKTSTPGPINEIESIVAALGEATPDRESTINRLATLFSTHADVTIDLLLDRRPLIRAAAVQALARTNNNTLKPFLWEMIDDRELMVAEAAARAVATAPDVVAQTVKHSGSGYDTETIARVWAFMPKDKRIELLQLIFNKTATPRKPPPPPAVKGSAKPGVTVKLIALSPGTPVPDTTVGVSTDPDVQLGALTLLYTIPREEFKLPLARLMASNYNPLIAVGLQVADVRGEALPLDLLFKLIASSDQQVSKLAAQNLGFSASVSDIPRIEALVSKDSAAAKKPLDDELKLSIKKIRFRNDLIAAKSAAEQLEVINKALNDRLLDEFAWRYHCEATVAGCGSAKSQPALKPDFAVKPFAENLFPNKVRHYTAIPNPGQSVQRFYETLNGLQMDSPRAQAGLVLMIGYLRQQLAYQLSAPADAATLIEYTGIDPNAPITLASWTSDKALETTASAERRAIVLRVKDRARFERVIQALQQSNSSFANLADYVGYGTRAVAAFPAILPLTVAAVRSVDPKQPTKHPLLKYAFVGESEWNGLHVKTIEHRSIASDWTIEYAATHVVFIGDTVILTPDLATIRDLLAHASNPTGGKLLADNTEFRKAIERRGDVVYFSDLKSVLGAFGEDTGDSGYNINESGALNISNSSWDNSHYLVFEESDWAKPLVPFQPKELTAPRELLPSSTIAYYFMKVDVATVWPSKLRTFLFKDDSQNTSKLWALDFKQDVLPELGPECGAALLELPDMKDIDSGTWAAFCKLKSTKLADALSGGKLFTGVGPTKDVAEVKVFGDSYFVATRKGFLVVSNRNNVLSALDGISSLAETRDYSRAAEKVPDGIVAFAGYNLEAAIAAANKIPVEGAQAIVANIIGSVAGAFHSQNFYATASSGAIEAHSSVAMDREGRYPIADFALISHGVNITFATLEPTGIPITDQNRLSSLVLKVSSKAPGPIEHIRDEIKTAEQTVEQKSAKELVLTIASRRSVPDKPVELPVKDPQLADFLKATTEFAADNEQVKNQARQIAGNDRDAWTVARKLADWTYKNLEWKHVASADAAQTLATREADCSEFSALFVAMARSLGLPARMVSGLAYSGNSFGGHAWVEVWAGKWIELDPTWGTDFVDATHIRNESSALVTTAALNLIDVEVLETKRNVAEFQKSAKGLTQHLLKAIPTAAQSDIEAAIDLPVLADEFMSQGAWTGMNDREKDRMWSAYRRIIEEIISAYGNRSSTFQRLRLLHLAEKDNVAEATCLLYPADTLLKLRLARRNDLWYLIEIEQTDTGLNTASDTLQTTIAAIEKVRAGQKASTAGMTEFARVLVLLNQDAAKAIAIADNALKTKPNDKGLRFLKALASFQADKPDDAVKLLRELSNEDYAPAIYKLASHLNDAEDEPTQKEVVKLWERYTSLEQHDSRGFLELGFAHDMLDNLGPAEAAYRKAIELNPAESEGYLQLITFLTINDRVADVRPLLVAFDKNKDIDEDIFVSALWQLYRTSERESAEKLATSEPARLKGSSEAHLILGRIHLDAGRYAQALNELTVSARLDKKYASPHIYMAMVHRKQSHWTAALKAAELAISLDDEDSEGYYQRACALARLGRVKEAMSALEKSVELDSDQLDYIPKEADLKALSSLPAFKKLLAPPAEKP